MKRNFGILLVLLASLAAVACGSSGGGSSADPGTLGGACLTGDTCNTGLVCVDNICQSNNPGDTDANNSDTTDGDKEDSQATSEECGGACNSQGATTSKCIENNVNVCVCGDTNTWSKVTCDSICAVKNQTSKGCGTTSQGFEYCLCEAAAADGDTDATVDGDTDTTPTDGDTESSSEAGACAQVCGATCTTGTCSGQLENGFLVCANNNALVPGTGTCSATANNCGADEVCVTSSKGGKATTYACATICNSCPTGQQCTSAGSLSVCTADGSSLPSGAASCDPESSTNTCASANVCVSVSSGGSDHTGLTCPNGQTCYNISSSTPLYECVDMSASDGTPASATVCQSDSDCPAHYGCYKFTGQTSAHCFADCDGNIGNNVGDPCFLKANVGDINPTAGNCAPAKGDCVGFGSQTSCSSDATCQTADVFGANGTCFTAQSICAETYCAPPCTAATASTDCAVLGTGACCANFGSDSNPAYMCAKAANCSSSK